MGQWHMIGEDEFASYGKRTIAFAHPGGVYQVTVDDGDQNHIVLHHTGVELRWNIEIKEFCDGTFRLQGVAYGGEAGDLLDDTYWFELLLTTPSTITYYGDRVIVRQDQEVQPPAVV